MNTNFNRLAYRSDGGPFFIEPSDQFIFDIDFVDDFLIFKIGFHLSSSDSNKALQKKFLSGLWNENVLEFFILENGSQRYLEFNFSSEGNWWAALFNDYRVLSSELENLTAKIKGSDSELVNFQDKEYLVYQVAFSMGDLPFQISDQSMINVTAIFHNNGARTYYSLSALGLRNEAVDFHNLSQEQGIKIGDLIKE